MHQQERKTQILLRKRMSLLPDGHMSYDHRHIICNKLLIKNITMLIPFGSYRFLLYPTIHLNTKAVLLSKGQLSCRRLSHVCRYLNRSMTQPCVSKQIYYKKIKAHAWLVMVRVEGVEPPRLAALDPKSSASANSATPAL